MQLKNNYWHFISELDSDFCRKVIDLGLSKIEEAKQEFGTAEAWTFGGGEKSAKPGAIPQGEISRREMTDQGIDLENSYVRDSEVAWLNDQWLYDKIIPIVETANYNAGWKWDIDFYEPFQFTVYNPSGFYGWHRDGDSDHHGIFKRYIPGVTHTENHKQKLPPPYTANPSMVGKIRKISLTINLNSPGDYEGGDLKFDFGEHTEDGQRFHTCEEIRPQGSIIVFPSFLPHCVTPVTKGTRYSLVLWCLGRPFV